MDEQERSGKTFGELLGESRVNRVTITRRYGCIRRDHYEITTKTPFPKAFRDYLASLGALRQTAALYVLEVPGAYQLTVAEAQGRALLVPRLTTDLGSQAEIALQMARILDEMLDAA